MKLFITTKKIPGIFRQRFHIILLVIAALLVACSGGGGGPGGGSDEGTGSGGNTGGDINQGGNNTSNSGNPTDLIGTWFLSCQGFFTTSLQIDATSYIATTSVYNDAGACATGNEEYTDVYANIYRTGASIMSDNGIPATELDVEVTSISRTLHTDLLVMAYNANTACGYSDWALNVTKDITGRDCGAFSSGCTFDSTGTVCNATGLVTYTTYNVNDADTQLIHGTPTTGRDGSSPAARMTTLLTFIPFVRQ